jgi:cysteine-rich repeat protein
VTAVQRCVCFSTAAIGLLSLLPFAGCGAHTPAQADPASDAAVAKPVDSGNAQRDPSTSADTAAPAGCGDGVLQPAEACDDGNTAPGDGCDAACRIESGWRWIPLPQTRCLDGSTSGIAVRRQPRSGRVLIYLQDGGGCFDELTCLLNGLARSFGRADFETWRAEHGNAGLFNRQLAENPLAQWEHVFVPYCSADVFAGNNRRPEPGGSSIVHYRGFENLRDIVGWLAEAGFGRDQVVLAGSSAGSMGALYNARWLRQYFEQASLTVLADSAVVLPPDYLAPCEQELWRSVWNLDGTAFGYSGTLPPPADCPDCYTDSDDNGRADALLPLLGHLARVAPEVRVGLISSTEDPVMRVFFGQGYTNAGSFTNRCTDVAYVGMPGAVYRKGICAVHEHFERWNPNHYAIYLIESPSHIWLKSDSAFSIDLRRWVGALVTGGDLRDVIPAGACTNFRER